MPTCRETLGVNYEMGPPTLCTTVKEKDLGVT